MRQKWNLKKNAKTSLKNTKKKLFKENANCESFYFKFVCRLFLILGQLNKKKSEKEKNENKF